MRRRFRTRSWRRLETNPARDEIELKLNPFGLPCLRAARVKRAPGTDPNGGVHPQERANTMRRTREMVATAAVFTLVLAATTAAGAVSQCTGAKLKATGKNILKALKCDAKAQSQGTAGGGE